MANQVGITLNENNDENIKCTITTNDPTDGTTLNLTGFTVEAYLKTAAATADGDGTTWMGSTATTGVVFTVAASGTIEVQIPASAVTVAKTWWRVDVINASSKRKTAVYGTVTVTNT